MKMTKTIFLQILYILFLANLVNLQNLFSRNLEKTQLSQAMEVIR